MLEAHHETLEARDRLERGPNARAIRIVRVRHVGDRQLFALATETHLLARNHALHAQAVHGNPGDQLTPRPLVDERRLWGATIARLRNELSGAYRGAAW